MTVVLTRDHKHMNTNDMRTPPLIQVCNTLDDLEQNAAEEIVRVMNLAIRDRGVCYVALSGGDTPRGVYHRIGRTPLKDEIDWSRVHIFFGDERPVPPSNPLSNFGMANWELISHIAIPEENVHRIRGEENTDIAAGEYEQDIVRVFGEQGPSFDLVLLGLGVDGHTASLFPGTTAVEEERSFVCSVFVHSLSGWRVTMTLRSFNKARRALFLVTGAQKAAIVRSVLSAKYPTKDLPATMVQPLEGTVQWMIDKEASSGLEGKPWFKAS